MCRLQHLMNRARLISCMGFQQNRAVHLTGLKPQSKHESKIQVPASSGSPGLAGLGNKGILYEIIVRS